MSRLTTAIIGATGYTGGELLRLLSDHPGAEVTQITSRSRMGEYAHADLNRAISEVVSLVQPRTLFVPHPGDIHLDHQRSFLSALVAARPYQRAYPARILAYETLSETNWNAPYLTPGFLPNLFIDISDTLARKLDAFARFESQQKPAPHERSVAALTALATLRGATVHRHAAEAFVTVRMVE